ncbi:hypothetical protein ABW20_dc0104094 [Dactylellina cionopaga]|nr:hypothetical protein ABW20_dc0104094 [Dactylellina cionopaga]
MFTFIREIVTLVAAAAFILPVVATAAPNVASAPPGVSIGNIIYGGTGCPQGSAYVSLSSDRQSFTAYFQKFVVYMNTASNNIKDARKFCQLNLAINSPPGWQFTVVQTSFTGYASLGPDVTATHTSSNYFAGDTDEQTYSAPIVGPTYRDFIIRSTSIVGEGNWSPCGTQSLLNVKSELLLSGDGYGAVRESKASGTLSRIFDLQWRTC